LPDDGILAEMTSNDLWNDRNRRRQLVLHRAGKQVGVAPDAAGEHDQAGVKHGGHHRHDVGKLQRLFRDDSQRECIAFASQIEDRLRRVHPAQPGRMGR
jgi:hypothetical protein